MILSVWKFQLEMDDCVTLEMPRHSKILSFQFQNGAPCVWALVDPKTPKWMRRFRFTGTGRPIDESAEELEFIGTAQTMNGALVFHLFEIVGRSDDA